MLAIIAVIIARIIAIIGVLKSNTAGPERGIVFGLTRTGAGLLVLTVIGIVIGMWLAKIITLCSEKTKVSGLEL